MAVDDWDVSRVVLVGLAGLVLVTLVVAASTSTTAFGTYNRAWDGASELQDLSRDVGAEPSVARDLTAYRDVDPDDTTAVVLAPREAYTDAEVARLRTFVRDGGTLVVADDFGTGTNGLLARLGVSSRLDGTLLRDDRFFYRSSAIVVATNVTAHPLTAGVERLAINHGTAIAPNGARVLASTSGYAYGDANGNGELDDAETLASYPIVTVEPVESGRVVVAGDPSLFINVMLDREDNRGFVRNLFGGEAVLLDYSHAGRLPPLSVAVLVLRGSPGLQVGLGLAGLVALAGQLAGWRPRRGRSPPDPAPTLTAGEMTDYVARQHPEWDDERVARVVRGIMSRRGQPRPE